MRYAVVWSPRATDRIDVAWRAGNPVARSEIEAAIVEAERQFSASPMVLGESRDEMEKRVMILPPVTFFYRVDNAHRVVRVVAVCVYRPDWRRCADTRRPSIEITHPTYKIWPRKNAPQRKPPRPRRP